MNLLTKQEIETWIAAKNTTVLSGNQIDAALHTALDALARLEYAEAAQALVVERAAKLVDKRAEEYDREFGIYDYTTGVTEYPGTGSESMEEWESISTAIRALADPFGVAALAALRAERDVLRADRDSAARMWQAAEQEKDAAVARSREASKMLAIETNHAAQAEAERDDLRARLAAAEGRVAALTEAYWRLRSYAVHDNDCKLNKPPKFAGPCSCGLAAAIKAGEQTATVTPPADTTEGRT